MLHRFEDAIHNYDQAIEIGNCSTSYNKGNALVISGRFREALSCYEDVLKKKTDNSGAIRNREAVLEILDEIKGRDFQTRFSPENLSIEISLQGAFDGSVYVFQGNTGNTGNEGGLGLRGGEGFGGRKGFTVILKRGKES